MMEKDPGGLEPPGSGRVIHPPSPGYPLSDCFPAEPDSVSPGTFQYNEEKKGQIAQEKRCSQN